MKRKSYNDFSVGTIFDADLDQDVPDDSTTKLKKKHWEHREYILDIDPKGKDLNASFTRTKPPVTANDVCHEGSLEICAYFPCVIKILLSDRWTWVFPNKAIKTGRGYGKRYVNLRRALGNKSLTFYSNKKANGSPADRDHFNIYVMLDLGDGLALHVIDPDIKNPGDHPGKPPKPAKKKSKTKR